MFDFKTSSRSGVELYLDIRNEVFKRFGKDIKFGTRVITSRGKGTVMGVCKKGLLWFQIDSEPGVSYWDDIQDERTLLMQMSFEKPAGPKNPSSLKNIVKQHVIDNSNKIKNVIVDDYADRNILPDNFYRSAYDTLIDSGIKKSEAPALFEELALKKKEEALLNSIGQLRYEVKKLEKLTKKVLKENELISKQNGKLLSIIEDLLPKSGSKSMLEASGSDAEQKSKRLLSTMF